MFYSIKLVSIALLLAVGLDHTQTTPRRQTPSKEENAIYINFTKLDKLRFLLGRINRANSHWSYYIWAGGRVTPTGVNAPPPTHLLNRGGGTTSFFWRLNPIYSFNLFILFFYLFIYLFIIYILQNRFSP